MASDRTGSRSYARDSCLLEGVKMKMSDFSLAHTSAARAVHTPLSLASSDVLISWTAVYALHCSHEPHREILYTGVAVLSMSCNAP